MEVARSDRACQLCKQRRVKCDKILPRCRRCDIFGRECPGYPPRRKFINQTRQVLQRVSETHASSPPHGECASTDQFSQDGFSTLNVHFGSSHDVVPTIDFASTLQGVPGLARQATPTNTANSSIHSSAASQPAYNTSLSGPLTSISSAESLTVASSPSRTAQVVNESPLFFDYQADSDYFDLDIETYYANGNNACGFFPGVTATGLQSVSTYDLDPILQEWPSTEDWLTEHQRLPELEPREIDEAHQYEIALLLRVFVELLAPWMDMFDINAYFTRTLPTHANLNALLQYTLAAVAAKQTARFISSDPSNETSNLYALLLSQSKGNDSGQWFYKAASYYDRAISHLRGCLNRCGVSSGVMSVGAQTPSTIHNPLSTSSDSRMGQLPLPQHVLSAISILSVYENLDDLHESSSQHLPGFLALLRSLNPSLNPISTNTQSVLCPNSAGRAAFWYFARKEMFSAYANRSTTKLDPDSPSLWILAGIPSQIYHRLSSGDLQGEVNDPETIHTIKSPEVMGYILLFLTIKVINQIAPQSHHQSSGASTQQMQTPSGEVSLNCTPEHGTVSDTCGVDLRKHLKWWYEQRPPLFHPYAVIKSGGDLANSKTSFKTAFFSSHIGAAAMQLYHFAQILLLSNLSEGRSMARDPFAQIRKLKHVAEDIAAHSKDICSIALGSSPFAIQRQMSHPLHLAGACFDMSEERQLILDLLKNAAIETNSPAERVVEGLVTKWDQNDRMRNHS